jgi:MurNAc alpha-1-phosphate uridylyltransferase
MQCAILAGGLATRMRPATTRTPKWLLEVAGRPFAAWQLEWLAGQGVRSVVACVGHLADAIRATVGDGAAHGISVSYSEDGPQLLGTGGALRRAARAGLLEDRFLVLYGDSYLPIDIAPVWRAFRSSGRPALMTVYRNEGRFDRSNVAYADGAVLRYTKSGGGDDGPPLHHIDYGLSALERPVLEELPSDDPADLADLYSDLAAAGRLAGHPVDRRFYEIGSPEGLRQLEEHLAAAEARP